MVGGFVLGRQDPFVDRQRPIEFDPARPEFYDGVRLTFWDNRDGIASRFERFELAPYRIVVDGDRVLDALDGERRVGGVWQIDLCDGRIKILSRRTPTE